MTLKELNDFIAGDSLLGRCFFVYSDATFTKKIKEIWTPEYDGYGGIYEHGWNSNPDVNREVVTFRAAGWQANIYYVVLK